MRKIISPVVLIILCLFISQTAFPQPGPFKQAEGCECDSK